MTDTVSTPTDPPAPKLAPKLALGDPLRERAAEDTPEAWGERGESESDRLSRYETERPPHHEG